MVRDGHQTKGLYTPSKDSFKGGMNDHSLFERLLTTTHEC